MVFMRRRWEPMVACSSMVGIKCQSKSNKQWSLCGSLKVAVWSGHCWEIAARRRHRCWAITKNRQQRYPTMPPERAVRHRHWQSQRSMQEHASDITNCVEVPSLDVVKELHHVQWSICKALGRFRAQAKLTIRTSEGCENFLIQLRCHWCTSCLDWHTSLNLFFWKGSLYVTPLLMQHSVANIYQRKICTKCLGQRKGSKGTALLGFACHVYHGDQRRVDSRTDTWKTMATQLIGSSMHDNNVDTDRKSSQLALLVLKKKTSQYTVAQGDMRAQLHFTLQCKSSD